VVQVLLESGANAETTNDDKWTALHYAANDGSEEVCRVLVDGGAKVNPMDSLKNTPLHKAAQNGYLLAVKMLVEKGADLMLKNIDDQNASEVAREKHSNVTDWLDRVSSG
jgi:serine/threonine-protein phosphatase 6 regulatory ankyrin repeat subunit B